MLVALREKDPLVKEAALPSSPTFTTRSTIKISSFELSSLSVDELWALREQVGALVAGRISDELKILKQRLKQLRAEDQGEMGSGPKSECPKAYPPVKPKYQNPSDLSEIWSGRGKRPRWLTAQLDQGSALEDFRISMGEPA